MKVKGLLITVFAVFVTLFAQAGKLAEHFHCICGTGECAVGGHEHSDVEWTAWTATDSLPTTAGYWYLASDVTLSETWTPVDGTYLCLNDHVIRQTAAVRVITVTNGVSFVLTDHGSTVHKWVRTEVAVKGHEGKWRWTLDDTVTGTEVVDYWTTTGGVVTGGVASEEDVGGAGISVGGWEQSGSFTLYGGNIVGNFFDNADYFENCGGGVRVAGGSRFLMCGGRVCGNYGSRGGGVGTCMTASSDLKGGAIDENCSVWGGGLYLSSTPSTVATNSGAWVVNNVANNGAGLYSEAGTRIVLADGAFIGNHAMDSGGALYVIGSLELLGGVVTNNASDAYSYVSYAGGIIFGPDSSAAHEFVVGGKPVVEGNFNCGTERNISVNTDVLTATVSAARPLEVGARLGVSRCETDGFDPLAGVFAAASATNCAFAFFSDDTQFKVAYNDSQELELVVDESHKHCVCGSGTCAVGGHEHEDVVWRAWKKTDALPTTAGYWYLTADVTLSAAWALEDLTVGVCLCLNGHVVRQTAEEPVGVVSSDLSCGLTLTDCDTTTVRYATDGDGDGCYETLTDTVSESALTVTGGVVTGGASTSSGGAFRMSGSPLTLYGGTLVGNRSSEIAGGVSTFSETFWMYGGRICGNRSDCGGGVGGSGEGNWGGACLYGGMIDRNFAATSGGGVYCSSVLSVKVGGSVVVAENTHRHEGEAARADNIYVMNDKDARLAVDDSPLEETARIGITLNDSPRTGDCSPRTFSEWTTTDAGASFFSDVDGLNVSYDSGSCVHVIQMPAQVYLFASVKATEPFQILTNSYGGTFTFPEHPTSVTRPGYEFAGWLMGFPGAWDFYETGDSCTLWSDSNRVNVAWTLSIAQQPATGNDYTVLVATTDPVTYQWQHEREEDWWQDVSGMTAKTLTAGLNGHSYRCVITYDDGASSVMSEAAVWERPDSFSEVRPIFGENVQVSRVCTNGAEAVSEGGKYFVKVGTEVAVEFVADDGCVFPNGETTFTTYVTAALDLTTVDGGTAYRPHECHGQKFALPIGDAAALRALFANGYSGYLTNNVTLDADLEVGNSGALCLKGHVLDLGGHCVRNTDTIALYDCGNGRVTGGAAADEYGGVFYNGCVLSLTDVNLVGNDAAEGAVICNMSELTVIGGTISGNRGDRGAISHRGYVCTLGGALCITNNVTTEDAASNLSLADGRVVSVDVKEPLVADATIGVTAAFGAITGTASADYSAFFTSDRADAGIFCCAENRLFLLGPAATVTFDANGGTDAPAAITTLRVGEVLTLPAAGGMTRTGYAFEGWMLDGELMAADDTVKIESEALTLTADWTLVIAQQPTFANGYTVGVGTTDEIGYQWYEKVPTPISEVPDADISATQGSYDEETNTFTPDEDWGTCCIRFGTGRSTGDVFTFKSTYGDYSQTGLTIVGHAGDYTLYQYVLLESEKGWWDEWELNLSGSTEPILDAALVSVSTLDEQTGAQLTTGENGTEYFCRLTYEGGVKTVDTDKATWYDTHDPVAVTADTGTHAEMDGVYTNGVKLVKEDGHYVVTYSEVVVAVYRAKAGYVFPDGTMVCTNTVMALDDLTAIAGAKAYQPHVHCLCGDGACEVPGHAHHDLTWKPWTATNALPTESGNWYLTEDVTLTEQTTLDAVNIRLCLNGHTVRQGADPDEQQTIVRTDADNCRFALTDCADAATPGLLTEGANGAVIVGSGVFDLWRGSLAGNTSANDGGAVLVDRGNNGVFRMYGGTICGNTASGSGGGVYVDAETHAEFYDGVITNNVAGSAGGGVFCLNWFGSYVSDVVIGGALVVTDNRTGEKADNLHCLRGEIAFSADVPLTAAARVGISYTGDDTMSVVPQVFAKAFATDCTAHLFSDDPFAYVAYNGEQKHELRTRVLAQPTAANGYTFELYTNGLAAGAVTYQWNTNAVTQAYLTEEDLIYNWGGTWDGEVCASSYDDENERHSVDFVTEQEEVVLEFETEIPADLQFGSYVDVQETGANYIRVTFSDPEWREFYCWSCESAFSFKVKAVETVNIPQEGETSAGLVTREVGTYFCRATIDGQTRDSDEVTVGGFAPAASVTTNGVTTLYATLDEAWTDACAAQEANIDATVKMLKDAAVESPLRMSCPQEITAAMTLDLNDHVLAYVGDELSDVIDQNGGALNVVDTAASRTPRYFTCDETGLWTLTNEVTGLTVSGGLLTGGCAGAINNSYSVGDTSISNVNFVGNSSTLDGGAVKMTHDEVRCTITASTFLGNVSGGNGGAVSASICTMTDCRVEANVAAMNGGGVYVRSHGSLVRTEVVRNRAGTGGGVCIEKAVTGCFPVGTKILMADGAERNIESLVEGDVVATFDHLGGTNSSAAVFYVYRGTQTKRVFTLSFASGAKLNIVDRHDLLLETTRKYVTVSSDNARSYRGTRFYNAVRGGWDELVGVESAKDCEVYYSIYTRGHGNSVANGFLTVPDDKDCFINIYELDENLKADAERLAADIATYGLAKPADYPNVPLDDFVDGNNRYAFIAIGKGLTTQEELLFWNEFDYGPIVAKKTASAPRLMMAAATPKLTAVTSIAKPTEPYLEVGEGAVVTGNVSAAGTDNVYLKPSVSFFGTEYNPVIDILPDATGVDVGVTLSSGAGVFGWTNAVNHAAFFFADDPTYSVSYTADGELALRAGIQVGGDAWATVDADGVCTIIGTGAMWNHGEWAAGNPLAAQRMAIKSVVVAEGVTSVGSQVFHKFYAITNVSCAASVTAVGDHAFYRCASLQAMSFTGADAPAFGTNAYTMHAGISIKDGMPDVYAIPKISISGYTQNLYGRVSLTEGVWEKITTEAQKRTCRFFKIVLEK